LKILSGTVVFTGPSLHPGEASTVLPGASILPPIKRDDLAAALEQFNPQRIAIIDGEFYQSLAVSPKEILPLLDRGVRVYGAASMGALRAVELRPFGMVGVGSVFRLFRGGWMMDDDEVALTYCPWTFEHSSEPLVSTRFALRHAELRGLLRREERREIVFQLKALYFPDRTKPALHDISHNIIGDQRALALCSYMQTAPDIKHQDALRLLRFLRSAAPLR
jgi:TfuA protein